MVAVNEAVLIEGRGLEGDRYAAHGKGGKRQVSLIQAEHLDVVARLTGQDEIDPERVRRNLVIAGLNVLALGRLRFAIGAAVLEGSGPCAPCSRMEEALGAGGFAAMRGHGGIVARVARSGPIRIGDPVRQVDG